MGILNITPDSFSDGGLLRGPQQAFEMAEAMKAAGVDILDVGGESSRPGAQPVSPQEEMDRVCPVIEALQSLDLPISLDSRQPDVVAQALPLGIDLLNDISGLTQPGMQALLPHLVDRGVGICIMHMQGNPETMQVAPYYDDVVGEVFDFLLAQRSLALAAGMTTSQILLDPGCGFGKTLAHNLALFRSLPSLAQHGPVLVGASRKRMLDDLSGLSGRPPAARLAASLAAALVAAQAGAAVLRVHDVAQTIEALRVGLALSSQGPFASPL